MRALISVSDKTGLVPFASNLAKLGYELVSTGGTMKALTNAGLAVTSVAEVTGSPEMLDGRVKTLHPKIHGGLLARQDLPDHRSQLEEHGIVPVGILIVNLYPFESTVQQDGLSEVDVIEQIDIGGPTMIRAGAKNFASVIVITDPTDYDTLSTQLRHGPVNDQNRRELAAKAFGHVSTYDSLIAEYLNNLSHDGMFPSEFTIGMRMTATPKYGENAHQDARAYTRLRAGKTAPGLLQADVLKGEDLSFNNYLDADAAWQAAQLFDGPTVAIIKHTVPCGLAVRNTLAEAYTAAIEGDPVSAFGGIVALNQKVDLETAEHMRKIKLDVIIAPAYDDAAFESLSKKKGTRILQLPNLAGARIPELDIRPISGGLLVQEPDIEPEDASTWQVVTRRTPTEKEMTDLEFAVRALPLIKSNAIVFVRDRAIVGVGAGQPNRLESVAISARKAGTTAQGAVMASDAFFPFPDGIEHALDAGITAIIQPGGSVKDQDVIDAADKADVAMIFTGRRHFRH